MVSVCHHNSAEPIIIDAFSGTTKYSYNNNRPIKNTSAYSEVYPESPDGSIGKACIP